MACLEPKFQAGDNGSIGGVEWRITNGRKVERKGRPVTGDLRLELWVPEWTPVKMALGFLEADFYYQNENRLYPQNLGFQGGERYLNFVRGAAYLGWEAAVAQLDDERNR